MAVAIEAAFLLFVVAASVCYFRLHKDPLITTRILILAISIPALSSLIVVMAASMLRWLIPDQRITFPAYVTLPILHCAISVVIVTLMLTPSLALERPGFNVVVVNIWRDRHVLITSLLLQIFLLSLVAAFGAGRAQARSGDGGAS